MARSGPFSDEWFSTTLRSIGDAVIATDAEGRVTFMNAVAEELTGWSADDANMVPLDRVFRILNEKTRAVVESPVTKVRREGRVVELANHTMLVRKDGSELPIEDSGAPIRGDDGKLIGVVLVFRDGTRRKREEERRSFMAEANALLASAFASDSALATLARIAVPRIADWSAVDLLDEEGKLRRLAVAHVDPAKMSLAHDLHRRYPPDPLDPTDTLYQVVRTGTPLLVSDVPDSVLATLAKSPEHHDIIRTLGLKSFIVVPLRARGRTLGLLTLVAAESGVHFAPDDLGFAEDLATAAGVAIDNARLYSEAQTLLAEANKAVRTREDLLAMVSHDLRNPLNAILMKASLVLEKAVKGRATGATDAMEGIRRNALVMGKLIRDLLDFGSLEAGTFTIDPQPHRVLSVVEQAKDLLAPLAAARSHTLKVKAHDPEAVIACDRDRLLQVLSNLVGNAIKFTPKGGKIRIDVRKEKTEVRFSVTDSGPGIPAGMLPRVFDRYTQSPNEHREGVGLGLYIASGIVSAHRGRIWVDSTVGEGSVFHFTIPRVRG